MARALSSARIELLTSERRLGDLDQAGEMLRPDLQADPRLRAKSLKREVPSVGV